MKTLKNSSNETALVASVGVKGRNEARDVKLVQLLLNDWLHRRQQTKLAVDGLCGPVTIAAIQEFQRQNSLQSDGHIGPGGPSLVALVTLHIASLESGLVLSDFTTPGLQVHDRGSISSESWNQTVNAYLVALRHSV